MEKQYIAKESSLKSVLDKIANLPLNADVAEIKSKLEEGVSCRTNRKFANIMIGTTSSSGLSVVGNGIAAFFPSATNTSIVATIDGTSVSSAASTSYATSTVEFQKSLKLSANANYIIQYN